MSATVLLTLLLAPAASGAATAASACETWTRDSAALPTLVREWFAHSTDERVLACQQPATTGVSDAAPLYFGEASVTRRGAVCSYLSHGLTLTGGGAAARLGRYDRTEALTMALAGTDCPLPHTGAGPRAYVETYDVSPEAFVAIMRLWSAASAPAADGAGQHGCCSKDSPSPTAGSPDASRPAAAGTKPAGAPASNETLARMQATLGPSRLSGAAVTRIVRIPGSLLHHRYALFINAPEPPAGGASLYVLYLDKHARGPYEITAFAETN